VVEEYPMHVNGITEQGRTASAASNGYKNVDRGNKGQCNDKLQE